MLNHHNLLRLILILDKHAPKKQKYVKTNNSNLMNKDLRKEIIHLLAKRRDEVKAL